MTVARLLLEIRRRVERTPHDVPVGAAIERAAREVLQNFAPEDGWSRAREILAALLGICDGEDFDPGVLDALTPEAIFRLDAIAGEIPRTAPH
jgi:hypothetical protein